LKVKKSDDSTGIIYIGHLPKGFNEKELKGFFNQFGEVSKLRVSRSKKTARSKGYAFLEFKGEHKGEGQKIAQIATKAMHNYMIFGRQLDVHVVEEAHREMFKDGNRDWSFIPTQVKQINKKNAEVEGRSTAQRKARVDGLL